MTTLTTAAKETTAFFEAVRDTAILFCTAPFGVHVMLIALLTDFGTRESNPSIQTF